MAFPAATNISGSNPGPNPAILPDTVQMATGNLWKFGTFILTLGPTSVPTISTKSYTFTTGIGLLTTDFVAVSSTPTALGTGVAIANARVSAADTLELTLINATAAAVTPATNGTYLVFVARVQPNWSAPASGNQLDW